MRIVNWRSFIDVYCYARGLGSYEDQIIYHANGRYWLLPADARPLVEREGGLVVYTLKSRSGRSRVR